MQLDSGHFQEQTQEYTRWKELRDRLAADLRLSFNNLKLQTSNLANHHLDVIKQLKELQFRILDQELNRWKRDQQLSGNLRLRFFRLNTCNWRNVRVSQEILLNPKIL